MDATIAIRFTPHHAMQLPNAIASPNALRRYSCRDRRKPVQMKFSEASEKAAKSRMLLRQHDQRSTGSECMNSDDQAGSLQAALDMTKAIALPETLCNAGTFSAYTKIAACVS